MSNLERLFQLVPQGRLGSRYRLDRCLGDGTYGYVWKAERLEDNAIVAIKIPKAQGGRNSDLEEGRALIEAAHHPNVVALYWMGRVPPEREIYVIEMEFFNSNTLSFILDARDDRFVASYDYLLELYEQVLEGVTHLHSLGIAHGDIKPQNILIQGDLAKLTDFGCSLYTHDIYVRTRENGGTVLYSPPEFAGLTTRKGNGALACSHDIYSLGVLLYQLLTGRLPHDTLAQVVRHAPFPTPRELNSTICPALEALILKCLEQESELRWHSIDALKAAFQRAREEQLRSSTQRPLPETVASNPDWSSRVLELMSQDSCREAEALSRAEFARSRDPYAFLLMIRAASRDERYFDVLSLLETERGQLDGESLVRGDLEQLALDAYLRTERLYDAARMVDRCIQRQGERPGLLLRKASILGMTARYDEARDILLKLNRELPRRPVILRRLVTVHEQLRGHESADAFRRALQRLEGTNKPEKSS